MGRRPAPWRVNSKNVTSSALPDPGPGRDWPPFRRDQPAWHQGITAMSAMPQDAFETTYVAPTREERQEAATQWVVAVVMIVAATLAWTALT